MHKFIFAVLFIMAQIKIPYQNPTYGSDLMAKEIINGTYYAAIDMKITNTQTGHERYIRVEDSLPEKMSRGESIERVTPTVIDSNIPRVDREKLQEDAVLPRYVDIIDSLPDIASRSQCPTGLTYVGEFEVGEVNMIFNKNFYATRDTMYFFSTDYYLYDSPYTGDPGTPHHVLYKLDGTKKQKVAEFEKKYTKITWMDVSDGEIYIYAYNQSNYEIYKLAGGEFVKVMDTNSYILPMVVASKGNHYVIDVSDKTKAVFRSIDGGDDIDFVWRDGEFRIDPANYSLYDDFDGEKNIAGSGVVYLMGYDKEPYSIAIIDGKAVNVKERKHFKHKYSNMSRFDFHFGRARFNLMVGKGSYPRARYGETETPIGDIRSAFILAYHVINYTRDFVNYVETGIVNSVAGRFSITKSHVYIVRDNRVMAIKIDGWSTVIPHAGLAELFAKEGMLDSQIINSGRYPQIE